MHVITVVIKQSFDSAALLLYCWKHLSSNFIFLQKKNVRLRNANFGKIIFLCGGGALEFNAYTSTVYSLLWETPVSVRLKQLANGYIFNVLPYQIIVADAADAVSVNFFGRCKFLQI